MNNNEKNAMRVLRAAQDLKVAEATLKIETLETLYNLINRQQTCIERLQEYYRRYNGIKEEAEELRIEVEYAREKISQMEEFIITIESKTVKEFAEKLKREIDAINYQDCNLYFDTVDCIDRVLEEMDGKSND